MKLIKYISYLLIPCVIMSTVFLTSCEEDGNGTHLEEPDGAPTIEYIRIPEPASSDSLLVSATLGTQIVLVGKNLGGIREIWFNDKKAPVVPSFVTNRTVFVDVPSVAPIKVTNTMYLIDANKDTVKYPFVVAIPPPLLENAKNEWPKEGDNFVVQGDYFFEPITVTFTGGAVGELKSITSTEVEVSIPEDAQPGPVTVTTNFGTTVSAFHFRDSRNVILNYDDLTTTGSWRTGLIVTDEHSLSGNYVKFKGAYAAPGERNEGPGGPSPYESQFWARTSGRPQGNFLPGDPTKYVMKFEMKVIEWYGAHLNICWAPWDWSGSNQEIWGNTQNARAVFGPWEADDKDFTTDGEWITVSIPMTEFKYSMGTRATNGVTHVVYDEIPFKPNVTGSLSFWVLSGVKDPAKPGKFEFYIDNVRIVPQ